MILTSYTACMNWALIQEGVEVEIEPINEEEAKQFYELVKATSKSNLWDEVIVSIISEEVEGYKNSMLILAAYEGEELLGIIRTVGDGATIVFVQDILVFPDKQRLGVGTALLKAILDKYKNVRQIELATDNTPKTIAFYKSVGFLEFSEIGCCGFMRC